MSEGVKHILEGEDGKLSGKRITAFWFAVVATLNAWTIQVVVFFLAFKKDVVPEALDINLLEKLISLELILCGMVLLFWGIVSFNQLIQFKNGGTNEPTQTDTPPGPE